MSQYATKNASRHVSVLCVQLVCLLIMDAVKVVLISMLMQTLFACLYWWENFEKEVFLPEEWHENFRMSRSSLLSLSELLHPSIEGQTTVMRSPVSLV